jgi:hypothetical protein
VTGGSSMAAPPSKGGNSMQAGPRITPGQMSKGGGIGSGGVAGSVGKILPPAGGAGKGPVLNPGKIDPVFGQGKGPVLNPGKIDPVFGQGKGKGPVLNPGKLDPVFGQGKGKGPQQPGPGKGGPIVGNGGMGPMKHKPHPGHAHTLFCKSPCNPHYHKYCGVYKPFGWCYQGFNHCHWYCQKWSSVHNCWFYYDYGCALWYYWCEPDACFYPCTYLPYKTYVYVAPIVVSPPVVVAPPPPAPYVVSPPVVTTTTTVTTGGAVAAANIAPAGGAAPVNLPPLPGE